ncbi:MAG: serine--tRNA ligase [Candidatus Omnitrophica bacterium]|nr:serine--tRNA ligase [Candidatus Omnitrophota bacterium]
MLDLKFIRDHIKEVEESSRNKKCIVDFKRLTTLDTKRRALIQEVEELKYKQNQANGEVVQLKRNGKDNTEKLSELKELSKKIKDFDSNLTTLTQELNAILLTIPNIPHDSVPTGDQKENKIVREWGTMPQFDFKPKDHLTIAEQHGYVNMSRAAKMTGSGFVLYQGFGAKLERALINFMIDFHVKKHNYTEVSPPFLVNRESMTGTGQLPKLEDDMYALKDEELFLIPTAEVPVTNIHRDELLAEDDLPVNYVAYTPCFRREAGTYGKDTRGLSRVHQFDKVELVKFVKPENSFDELETLVNHAEAILQALELPYRVIMLATGDLSFAASKCYDLEVWAPGAQKWFEVSSCSNFCDFQARRSNIKFREKQDKKPQFVHTLNGSGVALPRLVIALLENGQKKDGNVVFPKALEPYLK